jgi:hypothetical protein
MRSDDNRFKDWMGRVDEYLWEWVGLTSEDLIDQLWRDWFEEGLTPRQAAKRALEEEG